jgi:hypothetical protein
MTSKSTGSRRLAFILSMASLCLGGAGCAAAAAAGAGTIAGVEYSNRGAKGELKGSLENVDRRAKEVFEKSGIVTTEVKVTDGGEKRVLGGRKGDLNIQVDMTPTSPNVTHVEVIAQKSAVQWDKDYAKSLMQKIAAQT